MRKQLTLFYSSLIICKSCFATFDNRPCKYKLQGQVAFNEYKLICGEHKAIHSIIPVESSMLEFKGYIKTQHLSFVIYAYFEGLLLTFLESGGIEPMNR